MSATCHSSIPALRRDRGAPATTATVTLSTWAWALLAAGVGLAGAPASAQRARAKPQQPNILVIVLDDVGTDKLRIYGESESPSYAPAPWCGPLTDPLPYPKTPNLEALAAGQVPGLRAGASASSACTRLRCAAPRGPAS